MSETISSGPGLGEVPITDDLTMELRRRLEQSIDPSWEPGSKYPNESDQDPSLDLSFVPPDHKTTVRFIGAEDQAPSLYQAKTDTHSNALVYLSHGMVPNDTYDVGGIWQSKDGLSIATNHPQYDSGLLYVGGLEGLDFQVCEKDLINKTNDLLERFRPEEYEQAVAVSRRLADHAAEILFKVQRQLPAFEVASSNRYKIDLFGGGILYRLDEHGMPQHISQFGLTWDKPDMPVVHGHFYGNRFADIAGRILLIDDEAQIAIGAVTFDEHDQNARPRGFSYLSAVDMRNETNRSSRNINLLEQFGVKI